MLNVITEQIHQGRIVCFLVVQKTDKLTIDILHSNSPNLGALGPSTARNSEMSVSGNSQSSAPLYIVSYRHTLLLYMYMYTTIKNTSSVTILWKIQHQTFSLSKEKQVRGQLT